MIDKVNKLLIRVLVEERNLAIKFVVILLNILLLKVNFDKFIIRLHILFISFMFAKFIKN